MLERLRFGGSSNPSEDTSMTLDKSLHLCELYFLNVKHCNNTYAPRVTLEPGVQTLGRGQAPGETPCSSLSAPGLPPRHLGVGSRLSQPEP